MKRAVPKYLARNGWTVWHLLAAAAMTALGVLATWDAWADIYHIGQRDEESSHVFLAPMVAAWLVWVRRGRLRQVRPVGMWIGPAVLILGWLLHSLGNHQMIQAFWHGGAVMIVVGCFLSVVGSDVLRRFLPVFIVLGFLVPVPGLIRQQIALPLQTATAHLTQAVFEALGQEVGRSGNVLLVNNVQIAIAEACNGLRMVFALTLVAFAFAFGAPLRGYVRALILATSPVLAIAANVVRLLPTVWVYGYYDSATADRFHDLTGWVMLALAFLVLVGIIGLLRWALVPVTRYTLAYD